MKPAREPTKDSGEIRRRAEARLTEKQKHQRPVAGDPPPAEESARLVHELQVHQIELEMQNEELQSAQVRLEAALTDYTELYDSAPAGYLTLDPRGVIRRANLSAAALLGTVRSELLKRRFGLFVAPAGRAALKVLLARSFETGNPEAADLELQVEGRPPLTVHLQALVREHGLECQVVFTDITQRRQAEENLRQTNEELVRFNEAMVGRELRMIELKSEINHLCHRHGEPARYDLESIDTNDPGA